VCSLLEECGVGKQNICASYIYGLAQSVMANNGLERDYRRLKHLNGFGPKTALITIQAAYGLTQGIGVDVHVARILGALEWSVYKSTVMAPNQEEVIRACAEAILSPRDWVSVNNTCGALGQLLRDEETSKRLLSFAGDVLWDQTMQFDQEDFLALRKIYLEYQKEQA
jgi:endonuclease III